MKTINGGNSRLGGKWFTTKGIPMIDGWDCGREEDRDLLMLEQNYGRTAVTGVWAAQVLFILNSASFVCHVSLLTRTFCESVNSFILFPCLYIIKSEQNTSGEYYICILIIDKANHCTIPYHYARILFWRYCCSLCCYIQNRLMLSTTHIPFFSRVQYWPLALDS